MIYTGYFAKTNSYVKQGLTPVAIAGCAPEGYEGIQFKTLAPKYSWWKAWHDKHLSNEWYAEQYQKTVLDKLNPKIIANKLHSFGENVVLLCYEKPNEFCHRQLVGKWLVSHGIPVSEYVANPSIKGNDIKDDFVLDF